MARPRKYKTEQQRIEAQRIQKKRSAQIKRRQAAGLDPASPLHSMHAAERARRGKLTWPQVREIRELHQKYRWTLQSIARKFDISTHTASDICTHRTWKEDS